MNIRILLLLPLLLACSSSAPLEPAPSTVDVIAVRNTTEMNLGRMLLEPLWAARLGRVDGVKDRPQRFDAIE